MLNIAFAGMTHLGINSAIATAERGFNILCYDADDKVIKSLQNKQTPIFEPNCIELLTKNWNRFQFFTDPNLLQSADVVYISADVPTDDKGQSDLQPIRDLINTVIPYLNEKAILVVLCQVPPGFTRSLGIKSAKDNLNGTKGNNNLENNKNSVDNKNSFPSNQIFYQVETLIFGRAIERALYPERFIVGAANPTQQLPSAYRQLLDAFQCPIFTMRYESAELAKISINCCLVAMLGVANTLSEICEQIGADWMEIVPALKLDRRIGPYAYLNPGLGLAGGNLERDLTTVLQLSQEHGTDAGIVSAWVKNSHYRKEWVLKVLYQDVFNVLFDHNARPTIAVLGLAYKENTHSTKNSASLALLPWLSHYPVKVFDPLVKEIANKNISNNNITNKNVSNNNTVNNMVNNTVISSAATAIEAIQQAQILIIMTPWPEFKSLSTEILSQNMAGRVIIDPYRLLDGRRLQSSGFNYFTLGTDSLCQTQTQTQAQVQVQTQA